MSKVATTRSSLLLAVSLFVGSLVTFVYQLGTTRADEYAYWFGGAFVGPGCVNEHCAPPDGGFATCVYNWCDGVFNVEDQEYDCRRGAYDYAFPAYASYC